MTVARSVADVLDDHVVFAVESIDRMYLNVWQPRLAYGGGVQGFFVGHRGYHYASTALMDPMTKAFVADIHGFVAARGLELVHFARGQRKDDLAQQFLARFTDEEGVLFVGRAQEKAGVWRTERRYNPSTGASYAWRGTPRRRAPRRPPPRAAGCAGAATAAATPSSATPEASVQNRGPPGRERGTIASNGARARPDAGRPVRGAAARPRAVPITPRGGMPAACSVAPRVPRSGPEMSRTWLSRHGVARPRPGRGEGLRR